jgi:hypothetical protein
MRADLMADVYRKRDGYFVVTGKDDHYAEPTSIMARTVIRKPVGGFLLKSGDILQLGTYLGDFGPAKAGHIAVQVILYGTPAKPPA